MQVGVPRRDQRNTQAMSHPKTQNSHVSRTCNVHQIGLKGAELSEHPVLIPAEQGVAIEFVVQRECSRTSLQLQRGERLLAGNLRASATVGAKKWQLLALGKCSEFPAQRGYTVSFMERIREKRDAQRWRQYGTPASK